MNLKAQCRKTVFITLLLAASMNCHAFISDSGSVPWNLNLMSGSSKVHEESTRNTNISPFVEIGGKGFISLNVDFRFKPSHAVSIGFQPLEVLCPEVMYYFLSGKRKRFEVGGGLGLGISSKLKPAVLLYHGVIGYRYQKKNGLFFRAGFTPLFIDFLDKEEKESIKFYPFVGLSLGYCF
jgi:hypothetical protein